MCRYERLGGLPGYGLFIAETSTRLFLKCTNCGVIFPSGLDLQPSVLEEEEIEDKTYKCPVCANFDTYGRSDLFYDRG